MGGGGIQYPWSPLSGTCTAGHGQTGELRGRAGIGAHLGLGVGCRGPWKGHWVLWGPEVTGRNIGGYWVLWGPEEHNGGRCEEELGVLGHPGVALGCKGVSWMLWSCRRGSVVPGFRLQQHGGSLDTGRGVWGSLDTGRAAGRLLGSMWNARGRRLWRVWTCWDCREVHWVLWGSRGPKGVTEAVTVYFRGAGDHVRGAGRG